MEIVTLGCTRRKMETVTLGGTVGEIDGDSDTEWYREIDSWRK